MWLILGSQGQLGQCICDALTEMGIEFVAVGREECDITDPAAVASTLAYCRPNVVVNCAAWTAVDAAEDHEADALLINCTGATNVALACREASSLLVHISTDYVFSGSGNGPYAEDEPTNPVSAYGRSKLCGENGVLDTYPNGSYVIRTAWLYSRHGGNFAKTMLRRALEGAPVRVVADQLGQPTLADDLARHIINLVSSDAPKGVYHGTNSGACTWFDFAREIYALSGADIDLVSPVSTSEYPTRAIRPSNSVLGHEHTIRAGIAEMPAWNTALAGAIHSIIDNVRRKD